MSERTPMIHYVVIDGRPSHMLLIDKLDCPRYAMIVIPLGWIASEHSGGSVVHYSFVSYVR